MDSRKPQVIISVVSDLATDQRVNRAAITLHDAGFDVILVGRRLRNSLPLSGRPYKTIRFHLWFERGALFYATYNIRLFLFLLFRRADVFLANDLDTLFANYLVSRLKSVKLVYDSHEFFTEVPELTDRPFVQAVWKRIEKYIVPKLKHMMTVNGSIAKIYNEKYHIPVHVVRNLPVRLSGEYTNVTRKEWGLPENKTIFLFQGAGINVDRGGEEAIEAIAGLDDAVLLFLGGGDVVDSLKQKAEMSGLNGRIFFIPKQPFDKLPSFTRLADFGLTLDKDSNLNYRYSLPNKLFDYIRAGLPVLATDLVEVSSIVRKYDIGLVTPSLETQTLRTTMQEMMSDKVKIATWKKNINFAAGELCWENEQQIFLRLFTND